MHKLVSMLVPLETLAGWPEVANPTPLQSLGLLVGVPVLAALIIAGICQLVYGESSNGQVEVTEPLWVGGKAPTERAAQPTPAELEAPQPLAETAEQRGTGGASARW